MKRTRAKAARRGKPQRRRPPGLHLERLESRCVLDGELVTLVADVFDVGQNSPPGALNVLANDLFASEYAGARRITSVSYGSEGGSVEIAADGQSLRYAPPADFFGTETFVYVVDGQFTARGASSRIARRWRSTRLPFRPMASSARWTCWRTTRSGRATAGHGEITSVSVASAGGEVLVAPDRRSILYTPPDGAFGNDEFIYIVDGIYPARVTISIPETLKSDQVELVQHTPGTFDLLANDPFWPGYTGAAAHHACA